MQIMHYLTEHCNIVELKGAYEDCHSPTSSWSSMMVASSSIRSSPRATTPSAPPPISVARS
ncbi:Calcium-dependent protein kinase 1 [Glycine soja]